MTLILNYYSQCVAMDSSSKVSTDNPRNQNKRFLGYIWQKRRYVYYATYILHLQNRKS